MKVSSLIKTGLAITLISFSLHAHAERTKTEEYSIKSMPELSMIKERILNDVLFNNGRLVFTSKEHLRTKIDLLRKLERDALSSELYVFYDQGFEPLTPFYRDDDDIKHLDYFNIKQALESSSSRSSSSQEPQLIAPDDLSVIDGIDGSDDLIADDIFAALLNIDRELVIDDIVFKYTKYGLYSIGSENVYDLYRFLSEKELNPASQLSERYELVSCQDQVTRNAVLTNRLTQYEGCDTGGGHSGGYGYTGGSGSSGNTDGSNGGNSTTQQTWEEYLESITRCSPRSGWFGSVKKCHSYFTNRHRVKTKYWNLSSWLFSSRGVKVKHQKKGWTGLWRRQNTNELRLGINQAYFEYNVLASQIPANLPRMVFEHNGSQYSEFGQLIGSTASSLSSLFGTNDNNTMYIRMNLLSYGLVGNSINSNIVDTFVRGQLLNTARSIAQANGQNDLKSIVLIGFGQSKIIVNYMDASFRVLNTSRIRKNIYWTPSSAVNLNILFGGFGNLPYADDYNHTSAHVEIYGLVRRGSVWKGSKMKVW